MSDTSNRFDKETLTNQYDDVCPEYKRLAENLKQALGTLLRDKNVEVLSIEYRIKDFKSFLEKIHRKQYDDPLEEIEDICGLRIVCYYTSDLERISEVISEEFEVLEKTDKADLLEPDKFGYRSLHFVVKVKPEWLIVPQYRGLGEFKAEIQVRTILMYAWAEIEHKLTYKKKEHVPSKFSRELYRVSALVEGADNQFESLRVEREQYQSSLISGDGALSSSFYVTPELNLDRIQAFLDVHFPDREKVGGGPSYLLDKLQGLNMSLIDLSKAYELVSDILHDVESEALVDAALDRKYLWNQIGVINIILDLTNDAYFESRKHTLPDRVLAQKQKWRKIVKEKRDSG